MKYVNSEFSEEDDIDIQYFSDEGYSGKNLNRPGFTEMMRIESINPFDYIIVYKLDRISRNVADFSKLLEELQKRNTYFVTIQQKYDTSTSTGAAMFHMTVVFAQLERDTIAERIRDNMYESSKKGKWLGGTVPLGYTSVKHTFIDEKLGKERSYNTLEFDENTINLVKLIFSKYSELQSLNALEQFLNETKNYTRSGKPWDKSNVKRILINPCYCIADQDSYDYFKSLGCEVCFTPESCSDNKGILAYNRHAGQSKEKSPPEKWVIAISSHIGILTGKEWVRIQNLLKENGKNCFGGVPNSKQSFNKRSVLSGVLHCASCDDYMRPKMANGKMYYMCITKEKSKKQKCAMCNIDGDLLDKLVLDEIFKYNVEGSAINAQLSKLRKQINSAEDVIAIQIKSLNSKKKSNEKAIQNLITALSSGANTLTMEYINKQISELTESNSIIDAQIVELNDKEKIQSQMHVNLNNMEEAIIHLKNNFAELSIENKREFIKKIIEKVTWDGENATIFCKGSI